MSPGASQMTSIWNIGSAVCSGAHQRKHQSSTFLAFVRETHHRSAYSLHKGPVTWKMFPFDYSFMISQTTRIELAMSTATAQVRRSQQILVNKQECTRTPNIKDRTNTKFWACDENRIALKYLNHISALISLLVEIKVIFYGWVQ